MNKGFSSYQSLGGKKAGDGAPNRDIPSRVKEYGLMKYLNKNSRVLDIGCNRGYFGVYLSPFIGYYVGIDHDAGQLKYGKAEVSRLKIDNITLQNVAFEHFPSQPFDCILSLAVHVYSKFPMCDYASKMCGMLLPGGIIVLEGHPKGYLGEPTKLDKLIDLFENYFKIKRIVHKQVKDRKNTRELYIWQK